jgi:putative membrane protein
MQRAVVKILVLMAAIYLVAHVTHLIEVHGWLAAFIGALCLAVLNALVRPVLILLTLPITCMTLGFFILLLNGLILMAVAWITPDFATHGWWRSTLAALVISIFSALLNWILDVNKKNK